MSDKSENALRQLFFGPAGPKQALQACNVYGISGIEKILLLLHQYNLRSIGINDSGTEDAELLKEMVVKIMN
jgi:DNA polymerase-3 subunit delta